MAVVQQEVRFAVFVGLTNDCVAQVVYAGDNGVDCFRNRFGITCRVE